MSLVPGLPEVITNGKFGQRVRTSLAKSMPSMAPPSLMSEMTIPIFACTHKHYRQGSFGALA